MKIIVLILGALVVGGSIYADYRWRRWVAAQREERDRNPEQRA
jgi:hypothetical protein